MTARSHYEVLGVRRGATLDEIKAAYKRLTVTHRPSELSPAALRQQRLGGGRRKKPEASCEERQAWLEIHRAFDVLANPRRREPYDRRLSAEVPAAESDATDGRAAEEEAEGGGSAGVDPPEFSQLSGESFFIAGEEYFARVAAAEQNHDLADDAAAAAPSFGGPDLPWERVREFYDFWSYWSSSRDFRNAERHGSAEIAAAPNRQVRRLMEAEDDKLRRAARKAHVSRVREAAQQARHCDPRVRKHLEARQQEAAKDAACRAEEEEAKALQLQQERATQRRAARLADEARWAELTPELRTQGSPELHSGSPGWTSSEPFACLACSKGFKTRDAWTEHAKAKRHRHNARRWEEAGGGSPLVQHGSMPASPASCPTLSPPLLISQRSRSLSSPLQLPSPALPVTAELGGLQDMVLPEACDEAAELADNAKHPGNVWGEIIEEDVLCARSCEPCSLPPALETLAAIPSPFWTQVLSLLGSGKECVRTILALLSNAALRESALSETSLWQDLAVQLWGQAAGDSLRVDGGPHDFMELASSLDEACDLWQLLGGAGTESRVPRCTARVATPGFPVEVLSSAGSLIAAAARGNTEVRLFSQRLARLPPVRTRGKPVEALVLAPGGENLAVGASDGQVSLYSLSDPDEAPTRIHRVASAQGQAGTSDSSQVVFAGLHFAGPDRLLAAARGSPGAVLLDVEARGPPIAESCGPEAKDCPGSGLIAAAPLKGQGGDVMLLLETSGRALVWDVRAPTCTCVLDFGGSLVNGDELTTGIVDVGRMQVAAASPAALHWGDLRTQVVGLTSLPVEPSSEPPFLAMGSRGAILSWWRRSQTPSIEVCALASGAGCGSAVLAHAGNCAGLPLAACGGAAAGGNEPFVVSLASADFGRSSCLFQLCVLGDDRPVGEPQMTRRPDTRPLCTQPRSSKGAAAPAPVIRRLPGRYGPHTGRRRGGR